MPEISPSDNSAASNSGTGPDDRFSFERLIAPVSRARFFDTHYEKKGLTVFRDDPAYYAAALSVDRLDEYITSASPNWPQIRVVNANQDIDKSEFTLGGNRIDVPRLFQFFADGSTLVFASLHFKIPELAALCRAVEREFDAPFQTNVYLSPPNAQGFKIHYDTHDVFVLQVAGAKDWNVYDTPLELPLIGQKYQSDHYEPVPPTEQFRLNAGDLYYCPRGIVHDARSTDQISLHITFGLMAQTWTELMVEAVASACLVDPAFRENLPVGYAKADFDRSAAKAKFEDLLAKLAQNTDFDMLFDQFAEKFVADRAPQLRGQLHQVLAADALNGDSYIRVRPNLIYQLRRVEAGIILRHFKSEISFPAHVESTLAAMLDAKRPTALAALPGSLDTAGRVTLARRLLREGLVVQVGVGDERGIDG